MSAPLSSDGLTESREDACDQLCTQITLQTQVVQDDTFTEQLRVFPNLPKCAHRGSSQLNACDVSEDAASIQVIEGQSNQILTASALVEIEQLFQQECDDEVESPTLKLRRVQRSRDSSTETRIFRWLDEQKIFQVNPASKREEYYDSKRENLVKMTAVRHDTSVETIKINTLRLCKISNSPLFNRRFNAPAKRNARHFEELSSTEDHDESGSNTFSQEQLSTVGSIKASSSDQSTTKVPVSQPVELNESDSGYKSNQETVDQTASPSLSSYSGSSMGQERFLLNGKVDMESWNNSVQPYSQFHPISISRQSSNTSQSNEFLRKVSQL